jgi:hypothetical protein
MRQAIGQLGRVLRRPHQVAGPELLEGRDQLALELRPAVHVLGQLALQVAEERIDPNAVGGDAGAAERQEQIARPERPAGGGQQEEAHQREPYHDHPAHQRVVGVAVRPVRQAGHARNDRVDDADRHVWLHHPCLSPFAAGEGCPAAAPRGRDAAAAHRGAAERCPAL